PGGAARRSAKRDGAARGRRGQTRQATAQAAPALRPVAEFSSRTIAGMRITRLARIVTVAVKHGLDELVLAHARVRWLRPVVNRALFWRDLSAPRAVRLRQALTTLGPIFV